MDKRTLLAVTLSIMVLVAWSILFKPAPVPQKTVPVSQPGQQERPVIDKDITPPSQQVPDKLPPIEVTGGSDIIVETDLYKAIFSTRGGIIKSWELKEYKAGDKEMVMLLKEPGKVPSLGLIFKGDNKDFPQNVIYKSSRDNLILGDRGNNRGELVFTYAGEGITIKKRLTFYNDLYKVDLSIETLNTPPFMLSLGTDFGVFDKKQREHKGPVILIDSDRDEFDEKDMDTKYFTGNIHWIAQEDKYFVAAIIPVTGFEGASVWNEGAASEIAFNLEGQKNDFVFYAGPKDYDRLKKLNLGLEHIIDFGWFSIVAMPLFWVLKYFYKFLGNYGWAIMILTIIIRIPFIPILNKSQQSMKKMSNLQPMMTEIREKHKKDPQKMQKEITELYKKHKVNPIGGCLPMFLQIPVFIALYNVLLRAIELRGAPFILWITDLSVKDPYYIFPVVMGLSMLIQQKMTPSTMDPKQAKIMMFMPIVFTFMFLSFPAGLVLYWLVNNLLAIAQQYHVNKKATQE
jgi:YidC/Oxa1 family membrane protein insertase